MFLRYRIPFGAFLLGSSADSLKLPGYVFRDGGLVCDFSLETDDPLILEQADTAERHFCRANALQLVLIQDDGTTLIEDLSQPVRHGDLVEVLSRIANRILRAIRNFGYVVYVQELRPDPSRAPLYLRDWKVETSPTGEEPWTTLAEDNTTGGLFRSFLSSRSAQAERSGELHVDQWRTIAEAIETDQRPGPEHEFLTNALEYLRVENHRLAIVEAVICLEIVLTQFLRSYLKTKKGFSKEQLEDFVNPRLDLAARLAGPLHLIFDAADLSRFNIRRIRNVAKWRNKIVHDTGRTPEGIPTEEMDASIRDVLLLARFVAWKRDQVDVDPTLEKIAGALAAEFDVPSPTIALLPARRYTADFMFFPGHPVPTQERMQAVVERLIRLLSEIDWRLLPTSDLTVAFRQIPYGTHVRWRDGAFTSQETAP